MVGILDKDLDGKVSWEELPKRYKKMLVQGFKMVDRDNDGGLNIEEMHALLQANGRRARRSDADLGR